MANKEVEVEEVDNKLPFITIGDIQLTADELPDADSKRWFAQLQELTKIKAQQIYGLEKTQVGIDGFASKLVARYHEGNPPVVNGEGEEESNTGSEEDSE
tara:strand:+ start:6050 stop:6349 length:300 start_codon:yes stop_codon:yes gene_type:complete